MEMELEKFKEKNSKKTGIIVFTIVSILLLAGVFFFTSLVICSVLSDLTELEIFLILPITLNDTDASMGWNRTNF